MTCSTTAATASGEPGNPQIPPDDVEPRAPVAGPDDSRAALMGALADFRRVQEMLARFRSRVRSRYGVGPADADDIFQDSVMTYLLVQRRYPSRANHFGILHGILRNRTLMHLYAAARRAKATSRFRESLRTRRPAVARGEDPLGTTLDGIVRHESGSLIRGAVESLPTGPRELLLALAERRASRMELIDATGINRNTFDSRLRSARLQLQRSLRGAGVA